MTAKKQKEKGRRRARKLADQAWEAANANNLVLALKIMRRAANTQPDNPVFWNDLGVLLLRAGDDREADRALRAALSLAPDYAEPCSHLAAIRVRQGRLDDALLLQARAVQHDPANRTYSEQLAAYRALAGEPPVAAVPVRATPPPADVADGLALAPVESRLAALDWHVLGQRLTRDGAVLLAGLLDPEPCARLRALFDQDDLFARTVEMDKADFGKGTYRYFRAPLPALVDGLRRAVYPHAAAIANRWRELLGEDARFPAAWEEYRRVCAAAGQGTPTPILLRYGPGGFNALHRDLRGAEFFPLQLAVVLSSRAGYGEADGFQGGDFVLCDVPQRKKSQRRALPAELGDAVLFCTRDRLVRVGDTYGLQPVMHGVEPITSGTRFVLGVPFHEYR